MNHTSLSLVSVSSSEKISSALKCCDSDLKAAAAHSMLHRSDVDLRASQTPGKSCNTPAGHAWVSQPAWGVGNEVGEAIYPKPLVVCRKT